LDVEFADCGAELADHLPNFLRLMPKLRDRELLRDLVDELLVPALRKMIAEFEPRRIERKTELYKKSGTGNAIRRKILDFIKPAWSFEQQVALIRLGHSEVNSLKGVCTKAREELGWEPEYSFDDLVREMVASDYEIARKEKAQLKL